MTDSSDKPKLTFEQLKETANLATANASEEDKIKAMMHQSASFYNTQNRTNQPQHANNHNKYKWNRNDKSSKTQHQSSTTQKPSTTTTQQQRPNQSTAEKPPAGYFCHICGSPDHYIYVCPKKSDPNFQKVKRGHGIPRTFMTKVDHGAVLGAMLTSDGTFAVPTINA